MGTPRLREVKLTCARSHSYLVIELIFHSRLPDSEPMLRNLRPTPFIFKQSLIALCLTWDERASLAPFLKTQLPSPVSQVSLVPALSTP